MGYSTFVPRPPTRCSCYVNTFTSMCTVATLGFVYFIFNEHFFPYVSDDSKKKNCQKIYVIRVLAEFRSPKPPGSWGAPPPTSLRPARFLD